jgi:uncharacterized protein (PEP-CTERM system associated)
MATMRRDTAPLLPWLCYALALSPTALLAQTVQPLGDRIQPTLDIGVTATSNAGINPETNKPRKDMVVSAAPGVLVSMKGANSSLEGQWSLNAVNYVHGSQPDRILPTGSMSFHTELAQQGLGLDASALADQVKAQFTQAQTDTPSTADTYTNTRIKLSPFLRKSFSENTSLQARLERVQIHSSQNSSTLANRPDALTSNDTVSLSSKPVPMGYELSWRNEATKESGQPDPTLSTQALRGSLLYALSPELSFGVIAGRESQRISAQTFNDSIRGVQVRWRPGERSSLSAELEKHFFGTSWDLALTHRSPWLAMSLSSQRNVATSATSLGTIGGGGSVRDNLDQMLTTRITDPNERSKAVNDLMLRRNLPAKLGTARDLYDLSAQLRQATTARITFMGRRDVALIAVGMTKSQPLTTGTGDTSTLLSPSSRTGEYFVDTQLNHQLTNVSTMSLGLHWSRVRSDAPPGAGLATIPSGVSRDFSMRAALNTQLAQQTTATCGVRHQLSHNSSTTSSSEDTVFVGLGYRF